MEKDFAKRIGTNVLKAAVALQREATLSRNAYRENLYLLIAYAFAIARVFQDDENKWHKLLQHSFWGARRKKPRDSDDVLLTTFVFVFRASDRPGYGRAWKYRKAVSGFWDEGMSFRDVARSIKKAGGITKLIGADASEAAAKRRGTKTSSKALPASHSTVSQSCAAGPAFEPAGRVMLVIEKAKDGAYFSFRGKKRKSNKGVLIKLTRAKVCDK
ncbi:MAG: hypothetical protein J0H17_15235 [Rhizobiales bacterium]|nr:hypothetical protein [Hyphomicrobiales bacterium]